MPPRYAYWTILIDKKPTAFRAAKREELQPTFAQLQRTNKDVEMKWFARGRLWDTPEQSRWAAANLRDRREKRGPDWRPGGTHQDHRARFERRGKDQQHRREARRDEHGQHKPSAPKHPSAARQHDRTSPAPPKRSHEPGREGGWTPKPRTDRRGERPRVPKRPNPQAGHRPWTPKPQQGAPTRGQKPRPPVTERRPGPTSAADERPRKRDGENEE